MWKVNLISRNMIVSSCVLLYYDVIWLLKSFSCWSYQELFSCTETFWALNLKPSQYGSLRMWQAFVFFEGQQSHPDKGLALPGLHSLWRLWQGKWWGPTSAVWQLWHLLPHLLSGSSVGTCSTGWLEMQVVSNIHWVFRYSLKHSSETLDSVFAFLVGYRVFLYG